MSLENVFMASVAKCNILISHNHGYYCLGRTAQEAFFRAYYLRQACEVQRKALSMTNADHSKLRLISEQRKTDYSDAMYTSEDYNYDGETEWSGLLRWLEKKQAGLQDLMCHDYDSITMDP